MIYYVITIVFKFISDKSESIASTSTTSTVHTLDEFQLPLKFKRPFLDEAEINAINVCTF